MNLSLNHWLIRHGGSLAIGAAAGSLLLIGFIVAGMISPEYPRTLAQIAGIFLMFGLGFVLIFAYAAIIGGPAIFLLQKVTRITLGKLLILGWVITLPFEIYWTAINFNVAQGYDETKATSLLAFALEPYQLINNFLAPAIATAVVVVIYWFLAWRRGASPSLGT